MEGDVTAGLCWKQGRRQETVSSSSSCRFSVAIMVHVNVLDQLSRASKVMEKEANARFS